MLKQAETDFKTLVELWGEDHKTAQPEDFFKVFDAFTTLFKVCHFMSSLTPLRNAWKKTEKKKKPQRRLTNEQQKKQKGYSRCILIQS